MGQRDGARATAASDRAARRRVTMTDVARLAECSQSTVSVVLNNTPGIHISAATRERVFAAARQLKYEIARSATVPGERPLQVAVIFDRIATSPEAVVSIDGVRESAWATGHVVTICETLDNPEMERRALDAVMHSETDLVVYATIMTRKVEVPRRLYAREAAGRASQLLHRRPRLPERRAGRGGGRPPRHRRADRGRPPAHRHHHRRDVDGRGARPAEGLPPGARHRRHPLRSRRWCARATGRPSAGYEQTNILMDLPRPPTAIFCSNDRMAVGCYEALKERRLAIPDDVSVIGYDDEEVARHLSPQLTTLVLPHREMGRWAVERGFSLVSEPAREIPDHQARMPADRARLDRRAEATGRRAPPCGSRAAETV